MSPLEFATVQQLVDELAKRHHGLILAALSPAGNGDQFDKFMAYRSGGLTLQMGLVRRLWNHIDRVESDVDEEYDEGDEPNTDEE